MLESAVEGLRRQVAVAYICRIRIVGKGSVYRNIDSPDLVNGFFKTRKIDDRKIRNVQSADVLNDLSCIVAALVPVVVFKISI